MFQNFLICRKLISFSTEVIELMLKLSNMKIEKFYQIIQTQNYQIIKSKQINIINLI